MKYNDLLLHFEKNVKVHKTPNLIGLVVGKFELVLPLAKFPVLNSFHEGAALSLDTIQSNKALIARLVHNRLLEVRFNFKNVRIRCVPKDINYLLSVVESETEYTKSAKGVIYVENQITYDDPTGDATLSLETTNLNILQSLKDELPHLLPNLVSGIGSEFDKLETPDLAFLAASSSSSSAEKIGGLFTKRDLPLVKEPHGNKYDSISFSGHDAGSTTLELLHKRSSCRDYSGEPLEQKKLFSLLERISTFRKSDRGPRKLYPNGGAIYENQFYYLSLNTENLEDDFYYINEKIKRIEPLKTCPETIKIIRERFLPNSWSSHSQGYLFVTSSLGQRMFKYKGISLRHALVNVGAIIDFIYINCTDLDLSCCAHGSWSGGKFFNNILGNDFFSNPILGVVGIGHAAEK